MFEIVIFEPEIPPNTGNIIRLAANSGCRLHLVKPLGFELGDAQLRRAGLDYHEYATIKVHDNWAALLLALAGVRLWAFTTRATRPYHEARFEPGDALVFGPESRGLPVEILDEFPEDRKLRLAMRPESRSLNLSNTVAIAVYEAWRQNGFQGTKG